MQLTWEDSTTCRHAEPNSGRCCVATLASADVLTVLVPSDDLETRTLFGFSRRAKSGHAGCRWRTLWALAHHVRSRVWHLREIRELMRIVGAFIRTFDLCQYGRALTKRWLVVLASSSELMPNNFVSSATDTKTFAAQQNEFIIVLLVHELSLQVGRRTWHPR